MQSTILLFSFQICRLYYLLPYIQQPPNAFFLFAFSSMANRKREHPPRLQHSPSLPNIWFPPHSGPLPPKLNAIPRDNLHLPATPPALATSFSLPRPADTPKAKLARPHVHSKLLTPPLTPSSSIRTADSLDDATTVSQRANPDATRFLLISNISRTVKTETLSHLFSSYLSAETLGRLPGSSSENRPPANERQSSTFKNVPITDSPIKGVFVRYVQSQGIVVLAFFDVRYAQAAHTLLATRSTDLLDICADDAWFRCRYLTPNQTVQLTGDSKFLKAASAAFYISVQGIEEQDESDNSSRKRPVNVDTLLQLLESFGTIRTVNVVDSLNDDLCFKNYHIEYCDFRDADAAYAALDGQILFGMKLQVFGREESRSEGTDGPVPFPSGEDSTGTLLHFGRRSQTRERFVFPPPINTQAKPDDEDDDRTLVWSSGSPTFFYTSPPSDDLSEHSATKDTGPSLPDSEPGPFYAAHPEFYYDGPPMPYPAPYPYPPTSPGPMYPTSPVLGFGPPYDDPHRLAAAMNGLSWGPPPAAFGPHPPEFWRPGPSFFQNPVPEGPAYPTDVAPEPPLPSRNRSLHKANPGAAKDEQQGARNQLDLALIENGGDTRTTVMIKNIPNKMSDRDLMSFIDKVCPRRIDFMYLRMDFKNGCNVGYAFVNFIQVEDLLLFAKKRLGQKWNMFSSEKVLQMSYANYQGKEALVEKFKNSCIMDEQEAWQPKIFYSAGPDQGLPEPFPAPTHMKRKERSLHNRGTLFATADSGRGAVRQDHRPKVPLTKRIGAHR
ncbi:RNA recognition motif 2-domain-containing protein [Desarmillaria tabescens]|uniref:RNA recognition motif 2-domain-containing protein n=1 Tax=Armillaria tabescens TaxID=1929756 RepID=A0AA39N8V4_ARMTA|nr:RNA recognition motif 2-domain-containing protein [Desarmillaria tabescens]KAK0461185.1 RNA recognition motif 2-domain-containing protein [Desarmillaria tabescens]